MISYAEAPPPMPTLSMCAARFFKKHFESASRKTHTSQLNNTEQCAILFFSGVSYTLDLNTGEFNFQPFGIMRRDGKWIAITKS